MKAKVFLDKYDVQRIVAKHYNVDPKNVDVHLFIATECYGMDEHDAAAMEIIVTTGEKNCKGTKFSSDDGQAVNLG
ncbi:MAG: hypothetical protein IKR11_12575 [Solobacterium sp.]|nr:hypothetical protein [Solobacterium sp.]